MPDIAPVAPVMFAILWSSKVAFILFPRTFSLSLVLHLLAHTVISTQGVIIRTNQTLLQSVVRRCIRLCARCTLSFYSSVVLVQAHLHLLSPHPTNHPSIHHHLPPWLHADLCLSYFLVCTLYHLSHSLHLSTSTSRDLA